MIRFNNDYSLTGHKAVQKALGEASGSYAGYGADEWCLRAADMLRSEAGRPDAGVFFFSGATQANLVTIKAALSPVQSVICPAAGHINAHEAGAVESTGHKILTLPTTDGKITADQIRDEAEAYFSSGRPEYLTEPGLVYVSFSTEWGTVYSRKELEEISEVCRRTGMLLFVDGARLGYGLAAEGGDVTMADIARLADVFYVGGTKCGALFGEALLVSDPVLKKRMKACMKQSGAVLAKGWLMGVQFCALFENGLYYEITRRADGLAMKIREAVRAKGIPEKVVSPTNQQFIVLTDGQKRSLAARFLFEEMGDCVRICTSWGTKDEDVDELIRAIGEC